MIGPGLGWQELLIILAILALLFGASRVASLGGALGRGIREFRQEAKGDADNAKDAAKTDVAKAEAPKQETTVSSSDESSSSTS